MAKPFKQLREKMSPEAQERAHKKAQQMRHEMPLHELRRAQVPNSLNQDFQDFQDFQDSR